MGLVVGFDLDMTLLDTRPGIAATYRALMAATGVQIDVDLVINRLGPGLPSELANWFPADEVETAVRTFRSFYPDLAIRPSRPLPGALEAMTAVRAAGGTVAVITAKVPHLATMHLEHEGLVPDALVGDVFGDGKERAIRELGVDVYVGDHVADARAARAADRADHPVTAIGVTTGPCDAAELTAAGADAVLADLTGFPGWLEGYRPIGCGSGASQGTHRFRQDQSQ